MPQIVSSASWQQRSTLRHARELLGKFLVRAGHAPRMITEVEAYDGERDLACHARVGRTARTDVMYGPGGVWYVYLCYGIHEMLNLVVGPRDYPAAVLIRGVEGCIGPGRVTRLLGINRKLNATSAVQARELWIEDHGVRIPPRLIQATPRIGVNYAGPIWAAKPWRFSFDPAALPSRRLEPPPGKSPTNPRRCESRGPSAKAAPKSPGRSARTAARTARPSKRRGD
ncbi:MAG: DNA-3-methyladenine glycosylase [Verrucomicrobia bacterium]|nr:DNA-3-methyladenine glycosylase [Verrucomicrobiota bacterium]